MRIDNLSKVVDSIQRVVSARGADVPFKAHRRVSVYCSHKSDRLFLAVLRPEPKPPTVDNRIEP
jgi:hypothetical protein